MIFETEILVDLEKGLLLPSEFSVRLGALKVPEESFKAALEFLVWSATSELLVGIPSRFLFVECDRVKCVDEELVYSACAKEANGGFGLC